METIVYKWYLNVKFAHVRAEGFGPTSFVMHIGGGVEGANDGKERGASRIFNIKALKQYGT
jgi:hypothetical protein